VFFQSSSVDQNVIHVDNHNVFYYKVLENVIHYGLKCCQTVSYTKEHYQGFKKFAVSMKSSLLLISELNPDIVKTPTNIQFGKMLDILEL